MERRVRSPWVAPAAGPTADQFRAALRARLAAAQAGGATRLQVTAGDLHREVGGYPGPFHRLEECGRVMADEMRPDADTVLSGPAEGRGAAFAIRYRLPR